jgi:hypothetical protein
VTVHPQPLTFVPPHTCGDGDFDGEAVIRLNVRVYVNPNDRRQIWAQVSMTAREPRSDWPTAEGTRDFFVAWAPGPVFRILSPCDCDAFAYTDEDHGEDVFDCPRPLFRQLRFIGDTDGDEAGTRVTIYFNPLVVQ